MKTKLRKNIQGNSLIMTIERNERSLTVTVINDVRFIIVFFITTLAFSIHYYYLAYYQWNTLYTESSNRLVGD